MDKLHDLIRCEIEVSGLSLRAVAMACDISYPKLHAALSNYGSLDYRDVTAIEERLGLGYGYFARQLSPGEGMRAYDDACMLLDQALRLARSRKIQRSNRVTLTQFLDWWYSNHGKMDDFDQFRERVDIYAPPGTEAHIIRPIRTGRQSLATLNFKLQDRDQLAKTLEGFSLGFNEELVSAHLNALHMGEPVLSHPSIDETLPNGRTMARTYRRVLAPVTDNEGNVFIVNYSEDISV